MVGIISNTAALFAQRNLDQANTQSELNIARLSSGQAIIRASDDVSGLAIGTGLATRVNTFKTVLSNATQAQSLLQIADAGLQNISDILSRQKSLAVTANSGTLSDTERAFLNQEFQTLSSEIDRIVTNTNFNGVNLLDGSISGTGNFSATAPDANGDYYATGSLSGSVVNGSTLADLNFAVTGGTLNDSVQGAITVNGIDFVDVGALDAINIRLEIGGVGFLGTVSDIANTLNQGAAADVTVTFSEIDPASGSTAQTFTFDIDAQNVVTDQATADTLATDLGNALSDVRINQTREVGTTDTVANGGVDLTNTVLNGLNGTANRVTVLANSFDATNDVLGSISDVTVRAVGTNGTDDNGEITLTIDGRVFSTNFTTGVGSTDLSTQLGAGNVLDATITGAVAITDLQGEGANILTLANVSDAGNIIDEVNIDLQDLTAAVDLDLADAASTLKDALRTAFGISSSGAGGLNFQVGTTVTDNISVSLDGASTTDLYLDSSGTAVTLDISTESGANTASSVLDTAINTVTSLRADVGALQSRFDFASANVQSSLENTEAARSNFLDVDVASESTEFATAQVRLQASISVLAQANQIPQNLLKLIG